MVLPIITEVEYSDIIPLSTDGSTHTIKFSEGINVIFAENGYGKTTFCDILERSICSDAHAQRYSSFARKRASKKAYIKAKWLGESEVLIYQALTDAGVRTRIKEKGKGERTFSKEEYSNFIFRKLHLTLNDFQELFQSLYYKREDNHTLLGRTEEQDLFSFFYLINKYTSGAPEDYQLRQKIRSLERRKKEIQDQIKKLDEIESKIKLAMQMLGIEEVNEELLSLRHKEIIQEKTKKEEIIKNEERKIMELEKEEEAINELAYQIREEIYDIRQELDELKTKRGSLELKKERLLKEIKLASKIGVEKYSYLRTKIHEKPICEFCGTNLEKEWDSRIAIGCPLCGTEWAKLPRELKESLFKVEKQELPETETLEEEVAKIDVEIEELNEKIEKVTEKYQKKKNEEKELYNKLTTIRAEIKNHDRAIRDIMSEINESIKKTAVIETQLDFIKSNVNLKAVLVRKENLEGKLNELQEQLAELKAQETSTREREQILQSFSNVAMSIFGYGMQIDPRTLTLSLMIDGSMRAYDTMSGGEKYFVDICLRIAVWKYLIEKGYARQGMLIIDSPENALDERRLSLLAEILNKEKEDFLFIVTTRDALFNQLLNGTPIKVKKMVQTSLFDFIKKQEKVK